MKYLIISDVHSNLEALEAVLSDAPPYDAVVCLGDLVGYGAQPNECVARVRALPGLICLVGNHDLGALGRVDVSLFNEVARVANRWTGKQLDPDVRGFLEGLSPSESSGPAFLAHASPRDPIWEYIEVGEQGPPNFALFDGPLCLVGHTHVPRILEQSSTEPGKPSRVLEPVDGTVLSTGSGLRHIVNVGGVGQPRDGDPRAAYGILDSDAETCSFRRIAYPVESAQRRILEAGLPDILAYRLSVGF